MKITVTGATGYIGSKLIPSLIDLGHEITATARDPSKVKYMHKNLSILKADFSHQVVKLPKDTDICYYLMHSMMDPKDSFVQQEKLVVDNLLRSIEGTECKQIIYLSGLINSDKLSLHLASRKAVADRLIEGEIPVTTLCAGIVVGAGSASYQIIKDLVNKLPIMTAPKWINSLCQPIAINDAIAYLTGVIAKEECYNRSFDIGGPDVLKYKDMLYQFADACGLKRKIITIPILTPRLSAYWLYFISSADFNTAMSLIDSVKNNAICLEHSIDEIIRIKCLSYKEACKIAITESLIP